MNLKKTKKTKKTKKPLIASLIAIARSLKSEIIGNKYPPLYYKMLAVKSSKDLYSRQA